MKTEVLDAVKRLDETNGKVLDSHKSAIESLTERVEHIEAAKDRPGNKVRRESDGERRIEGLGLLVKGMALQDNETRARGELLLSNKAASGTTVLAGGNTIATELGDEIFRELRDEGGLMSLVRITQIDTAPSSYKRVVSSTDTNSGWIGETGSRTATNTPDFNVATPTGGMLYSLPSVTEELLAGSAYAVGEFLISEARADFRKQISTAIISGNGTNKPTGLTNAAPVSTADDASPRRAFNVLQYIATGAASGFATEPYQQPSPLTDPMGPFWDCMAALRGQYRRNAQWVMNSSTLAALGKLRDVDGKSLFSPNPAAGVPMSLLGYPVILDEYCADLGSNTFPVFFGDYSAGYELVSNFETRLTVDEISTKGYTAFYLRSYLGGCVTKGEAIKTIKCATS